MASIVGSAMMSAGTLEVPAGTRDGDLLVAFTSTWTGDINNTEIFNTLSGISCRWRVANSEPSSYAASSPAGLVAIRDVITDPGQWIRAQAAGVDAPSLAGVGGVLLCFLTAFGGTITAVPPGMMNLGLSGTGTRFAAAGVLNPPNPTGVRSFSGGSSTVAGSLLIPSPPDDSGFFAFF